MVVGNVKRQNAEEKENQVHVRNPSQSVRKHSIKTGVRINRIIKIKIERQAHATNKKGNMCNLHLFSRPVRTGGNKRNGLYKKKSIKNSSGPPVKAKQRKSYCATSITRRLLLCRNTPMTMVNPGALLALLAAVFRAPASPALGKLPCELLPFPTFVVSALSDSTS